MNKFYQLGREAAIKQANWNADHPTMSALTLGNFGAAPGHQWQAFKDGMKGTAQGGVVGGLGGAALGGLASLASGGRIHPGLGAAVGGGIGAGVGGFYQGTKATADTIRDSYSPMNRLKALVGR